MFTVTLVLERELLTPTEHISPPPVISGVLGTIALVVCFVICPFVLFLLAIVLSVLLRYTDYNYPFGIFKLFRSSFNVHYCRSSNIVMSYCVCGSII